MTIRSADPVTLRMNLPAILVVDDHPPNIIALESVLAPLPFKTVAAVSGAEAIRRAEVAEFVLILMDVHMPGLDGFETVERLRRTDGAREAPVVFLTAVRDTPEDAKRAYALGAVDYVTKPFDPDVLRAKVRALVSLYTRGRREERARREEMDRLRDLFLGAVGHDLRNPLNAIVMGAKLLRTKHETSQVSVVERIERSARRMNEIIDDTLHLVRDRFAGKVPLKLASTDLDTVCRSVLAELRTIRPDREIQLDVHGDVGGVWEAAKLARIVSNLVGNALKHTRQGPVCVRIDGDTETVTLAVHNGGPAIAPEILPRLFEPFRRGQTSAEGVGLGLYIVREIARAHGGTVEVRSTEAAGTTFAVTLPRVPPAPVRSDSEAPPAESVRHAAADVAP
jgi:signal transduction histidine kinase